VVGEHCTFALNITIPELAPVVVLVLVAWAVLVSVGEGVTVLVSVGDAVTVVVLVGVSVGVVPVVGSEVGVLCGLVVFVGVEPAGAAVAALVAVLVAVAHASSATAVFAYELLVMSSEPATEILKSASASIPTTRRTGVKCGRWSRASDRWRESGSGCVHWPGSTGFFLI
jgi:hypothetical protein